MIIKKKYVSYLFVITYSENQVIPSQVFAEV